MTIEASGDEVTVWLNTGEALLGEILLAMRDGKEPWDMLKSPTAQQIMKASSPERLVLSAWLADERRENLATDATSAATLANYVQREFERVLVDSHRLVDQPSPKCKTYA